MLSLTDIAKSPKSGFMKCHALLIGRIVRAIEPVDKKKFVTECVDISMKDLCIKYKKELWLTKKYPI